MEKSIPLGRPPGLPRPAGPGRARHHSTVTLFARFRGLSTSVPAQHRGVIREQLQRNRVHDRREQPRVLGQPDHVDAVAGGEVAVEVGDDVELAAARAHFLQVAT